MYGYEMFIHKVVKAPLRTNPIMLSEKKKIVYYVLWFSNFNFDLISV